MIEDKNGKITIEYKDIYNSSFKGDFELVPNEVIMACINEVVWFNDEFGNLRTISNLIRVIVGNPIYYTEDVVSVKDASLGRNVNGLDPLVVVGKACGLEYFVFPKEGDVIVSNRDELIDAINLIVASSLEHFDNIDKYAKSLIKK